MAIIINSYSPKKKSPGKFRNAEAAKRSRENQNYWNELQKKWTAETLEKKKQQALFSQSNYKPAEPVRRETGPRIASLNTDLGACTKSPPKIYTGTAVLGISTLHKSNAVPIFSKEEAVDISKMRR